MTGDVPLGPPPAVPIEHIDDGHPGADATLVARSVENKLPIAHALDGHRHPRIRSPSNSVSAPPSSGLSGNRWGRKERLPAFRGLKGTQAASCRRPESGSSRRRRNYRVVRRVHAELPDHGASWRTSGRC